jgi:hypothetical protein
MESGNDRQAMMMHRRTTTTMATLRGRVGGRVPNMTRAAAAKVTRERLVGGHSQPATVAHATALEVATRNPISPPPRVRACAGVQYRPVGVVGLAQDLLHDQSATVRLLMRNVKET